MRLTARILLGLVLVVAGGLPVLGEAQATAQGNWTHSWSSGQPAARFKKKEVAFTSEEGPGTIIIDTRKRWLYLVLGHGRALRYGIGVGREGFTWKGVERISRKSEWPDWRPPVEMRERDPELPEFVEGGPRNPLGARALYLSGTEYRIHGTLYPDSIGRAVSSGCIRLTNDDVIDLYKRVPVGTKVIVR